MINKLTQRHSHDDVEEYKKYIVKCPCCGTILNFGKEDVYKDEDSCCIHHEYIACPECNEAIMLSDNEYFGYYDMITEDYVSFETAKLLKEKGFDEDCHAYWDLTTETKTPKIGLSVSSKNWNYKWNPIPFPISAPTLQMVMKWLRNTFHLEIYPFHDAIQESNDWWYRIEHHSKGCTLTKDESDAIYKTYEQACEAAINYCIENLI